jgi:butyryl-CoA dehydrogenase
MSGVSLAERFPRLRDARGDALAGLERAVERARAYGERHVRPVALELDRRLAADPGAFPWEVVEQGLPYGLLSFAVPAEAGGDGGLSVRSSVIAEELCAACPGVGNVFGAHALGMAPLLLDGGARWIWLLRAIVEEQARGRPLLMAFAITEPDAGTDVEDPELARRATFGTRAERAPGGWRLWGTKRFISNGSVARWVTVCMPTDPRRPAETMTFFLVDAHADGFEVSRVEHKMGQRACPAAELAFSGVFVPDEHVVGRVGDGLALTLMVLAASRPAVAAIATGIARGAYERVLDWLVAEAPDRLERQEVQLALARMEEAIHVARQAYLDAALEVDVAGPGGLLRHPAVRALALLPRGVREHPRTGAALRSRPARAATVRLLHGHVGDAAATRALALASLAKAHASDAAARVTTLALEVAGLEASVRPELEKLWRDARLTQIYEGTNELNRVEVYRGLCRKETLEVLPRP